jgi:hypothetical protein
LEIYFQYISTLLRRTIIRHGEFTKTKDYVITTGKKMDALILKGSADDKIFFEINGNILTMYHGIIAADGTVATYERIKSNP